MASFQHGESKTDALGKAEAKAPVVKVYADESPMQERGSCFKIEPWLSRLLCILALLALGGLALKLAHSRSHGTDGSSGSEGSRSSISGSTAGECPSVPGAAGSGECSAHAAGTSRGVQQGHAFALAKDRAKEQATREQINHAVEAAAERLAAQQAMSPLPMSAPPDKVDDPQQRRAALRQRVEDTLQITELAELLTEAGLEQKISQATARHLVLQGVTAAQLLGAAPEEVAVVLSASDIGLDAGARLRLLQGLKQVLVKVHLASH